MRWKQTRCLLVALLFIGSLAGCNSTAPESSSSTATETKGSESTVTSQNPETTDTTGTQSAPDTSNSDDDTADTVTKPSTNQMPVTIGKAKGVYGVTGSPRVYLTTGESLKFKRQDATVVEVYNKARLNKSAGTVIEIDPNTTYQTIDGFGASFTDSAAQMIYALPESDRNAVMKRLFDTNEGIGLSYIRNTIGATDFATSWYTYDDMPDGQEDWNLSNFSLEHDLKQIIPLTKQAMALNSAVKVIASPWTAPAWMKTVAKLEGSAKGTLRRECYEVYAQYIVKYIEACKANGVDIYAITPQNEPGLAPAWPGMVLSTADQVKLTVDYLKPAFIAAGLKTKIYAWDWNWDGLEEVMELLVSGYDAYDGVAYHHYAGDATMQKTVNEAFPDKDIIVSEASGGMGAFMRGLRKNTQNMIQSLRNGGNAYVLWNMALNTTGGPLNYTDTSSQIGLINVDEASGDYYYTQDYYSLAHFSKFILTGAVRVDSTDTGEATDNQLLNLVCRNPNGSMTAVVYNNTGEDEPVKLVVGNSVIEYTVPDGGVATITWDANV